jgi:hypothetical protein
MYHGLRQQFWWTRMKHETTHYVFECDICRMVKADYMKPEGLLQPLNILEWKWDDISMDFIVGLSLIAHKFDLIWVIVDHLTKFAHFIPINTNYNAQRYAKIYIACVSCLHRVSKTIISIQGSQFKFCFSEQLHTSLGTHLIHSSAYHLQMDGQTKRVNQILEDILRSYIMEHQGSWNKNLPWVSSRITIVIKRACRWHHLRYYMDLDVTLHSIGLSRERRSSSDPTLLMRQKRWFVVYKIT